MRRSDRQNEQRRAAFPPESQIPYPPPSAPRPGYQSAPRPNAQIPYPPAYPPQGALLPPRANVRQTGNYDAPYPDAAYVRQPPPPPRGQWAAGGEPRRPRHTAFWAFVSLVCVAILALIGYGVFRFTEPYAAFRQMTAITSAATFAQGVVVDNVHIGGMTRAQAENALAGSQAAGGTNLAITVRIDDHSWVLTDSDIPFARNTAAVLDEAYAIGRQNSALTLNSDVTPLLWRYNHRLHVAQNGAYLYTEVTYDKTVVRGIVNAIASQIVRYPADAQVATFDFNSRTFTFSDEQYGATLDAEGLVTAISSALDQRNLNAVIVMNTTPLTPSVTKAELMNSFARVSTFTTDTTSNSNRNNNINLACIAVSGTVLMPGDTFSFNETTGERTAAKGYLPAAAIAGGTTIDEIGGGVCQVSSTLFNAAALADLTVIYRSPHTWPSNYVEKGRDATVNWPNLDFKFQNSSDMPIFIVAYYQNRKCTVEIYGRTLGAGESIDLKTVTLSTTQPPAEPAYTQNPQLAPGTQQELKKARTGYVVETYRVYYRNGAEYRRDKLCTSTYRMIQQVIEFN